MAMNRRIVLDDAEIDSLVAEELSPITEVPDDPGARIVQIGDSLYTLEEFNALKKAFSEAVVPKTIPQTMTQGSAGCAPMMYLDYTRSEIFSLPVTGSVNLDPVSTGSVNLDPVSNTEFHNNIQKAIRNSDPAGMNFQDWENYLDW